MRTHKRERTTGRRLRHRISINERTEVQNVSRHDRFVVFGIQSMNFLGIDSLRHKPVRRIASLQSEYTTQCGIKMVKNKGYK